MSIHVKCKANGSLYAVAMREKDQVGNDEALSSLTVAAELDPAACQRVNVWSLDLGSRRQPSAGTMIAHISPSEVVHDECKDCRGCQPTRTDEVAEPGWQLCS